jgi:hypothetical protein
MGNKERKFPAPFARLKMVAPCLLVLYFWSAKGIYVVKDSESRWLKWLLKQGGVIQTYRKHRDNQCALKLPKVSVF